MPAFPLSATTPHIGSKTLLSLMSWVLLQQLSCRWHIAPLQYSSNGQPIYQRQDNFPDFQEIRTRCSAEAHAVKPSACISAKMTGFSIRNSQPGGGVPY